MTRKEMEELIADYSFGRLDKETAEKYAQNLANYPDLAVEVEETRKVFSKIESMDFDAILDNRTRNLSAKVHQKRNFKRSNQSSTAFLIKFAVPAAVIMALAITVFKGGVGGDANTTNEIPTGFRQQLQSSIVLDANIESIVDYDYLSLSNPVFANYDNYLQVDELVDFLKTKDANEKSQIFNQISNLVPTTDYQIYDDIDDLKEDEIQLLLQEIKNVQI
jgi:hypothetical protein